MTTQVLLGRYWRVAIPLAVVTMAVLFGLLLSLNPLAALGATAMMAVFVVVGLATLESPIRGSYVLLALCVFLVDMNFRGTITGELIIDPQVIGKVAVYCTALLYAVTIARRASIGTIELSALIYALLLTCTAVYAIDPLVALGGAFILWSQALLCLGIGTRADSNEKLKQVWKTVYVAVFTKIAASWLLYYVNPDAALYNDNPYLQHLNEWALPRFGGFLGPNGMGFSSALLGVLSLVALLTVATRIGRITSLGSGLLAIVSLISSQSRTGLMCFVVGVLFVVGFVHRRAFYWLLVVAVALGTYALIYQPEAILGMATRGRSLESLSSLEGRTEIWRALNQKILDEPILGYGYGSARKLVPQVRIEGAFDELYSAHNMFYEAMLNGGIPVTLLLVGMILGAGFLSWRELLRQPRGSDRYLIHLRSLSVLAVVVTNGLSESGISGIQTVQALLFFLVLATIASDRRLSEQAPVAVSRSTQYPETVAQE